MNPGCETGCRICGVLGLRVCRVLSSEGGCRCVGRGRFCGLGVWFFGWGFGDLERMKKERERCLGVSGRMFGLLRRSLRWVWCLLVWLVHYWMRCVCSASVNGRLRGRRSFETMVRVLWFLARMVDLQLEWFDSLRRSSCDEGLVYGRSHCRRMHRILRVDSVCRWYLARIGLYNQSQNMDLSILLDPGSFDLPLILTSEHSFPSPASTKSHSTSSMLNPWMKDSNVPSSDIILVSRYVFASPRTFA